MANGWVSPGGSFRQDYLKFKNYFHTILGHLCSFKGLQVYETYGFIL